MKNSGIFKIFIVEDDEFYAQVLSHHLSLNPDYEVKNFRTASDCIAALHQQPAVITLDYSLPDMTGVDALKKIKAYNPEIPIVIISGQEDVNTAINLLKQGAYDYIVKDDDTKERIWNTINNIRQNTDLKIEIAHLKEEIGKKYAFDKAIIGSSESIKKVYQLIEKAVNTNISVSITGETGTGKELVAKSIHYNSTRNKQPFVAINVAAIPKELLESELFGHEKGSFTGAVARRIGKFEEANKGTLFLDEIAELDINLQAKLLRVLQEREITRVGANNSIAIDVRLIIATQKNLAEEVKKGTFREDLYYRLLGMPIGLPPLRERGNDILLIAKHYMDLFCEENKLEKKQLSNDAQKKLFNYSYPGNIRELKAIIELAVVMSNDKVITEEDITFNQFIKNDFSIHTNCTLKQHTQLLIQHYLDTNNQDVLKVAALLDIGKSTIYRMLKEGELKN